LRTGKGDGEEKKKGWGFYSPFSDIVGGEQQ
jgi:hypothetical protein